MCLGEPANDIPPFPEWDDAEFRKIPTGPYKVEAGGPTMIENFLDIAHFHLVHEGILGDQGHPEIEDYEARINQEGVIAEERAHVPDPTPMAPAWATPWSTPITCTDH